VSGASRPEPDLLGGQGGELGLRTLRCSPDSACANCAASGRRWSCPRRRGSAIAVNSSPITRRGVVNVQAPTPVARRIATKSKRRLPYWYSTSTTTSSAAQIRADVALANRMSTSRAGVAPSSAASESATRTEPHLAEQRRDASGSESGRTRGARHRCARRAAAVGCVDWAVKGGSARKGGRAHAAVVQVLGARDLQAECPSAAQRRERPQEPAEQLGLLCGGEHRAACCTRASRTRASCSSWRTRCAPRMAVGHPRGTFLVWLSGAAIVSDRCARSVQEAMTMYTETIHACSACFRALASSSRAAAARCRDAARLDCEQRQRWWTRHVRTATARAETALIVSLDDRAHEVRGPARGPGV